MVHFWLNLSQCTQVEDDNDDEEDDDNDAIINTINGEDEDSDPEQ